VEWVEGGSAVTEMAAVAFNENQGSGRAQRSPTGLASHSARLPAVWVLARPEETQQRSAGFLPGRRATNY
jgi:hypothetical protein